MPHTWKLRGRVPFVPMLTQRYGQGKRRQTAWAKKQRGIIGTILERQLHYKTSMSCKLENRATCCGSIVSAPPCSYAAQLVCT